MTIKTINDKLNEGRQYRDIRMGDLVGNNEVKSVEGYATTFDQRYLLWSYDGYTVYEQIDARAFDECDMSDVIMQYNHEGRVFARTSNGTLALSTDEHGLHIRANLSGTELGRQVFDEIKGGYTTKMSFGFRVEEDKREVTENHEDNSVTVVRTITKIGKLYDVSAVSIPANDATQISARTFGEGVIAEVMEEYRARAERDRQRKRIKIMTEVL